MTWSAATPEQTAKLSAGDFTRLSRVIYETCGIKMAAGKKTMLEARLQKRLRALSLRSFSDYCAFLFGSSGKDEMVRMLDLATTNKTEFFREPDHYDYLARKALPEWLERNGVSGVRKLKVWSAGCSSGEEPYTLAMVINEFFNASPLVDFQILATDICTRVLETALMGIYREERIDPIPPVLKKKYLLRSRDRGSCLVRVVPELREKIRFRRLNLMAEEFGIREAQDVIFCRNVIIYFDRPTQERLLNRLWCHLATGGYLFMGHSETLNGLNVPFKQVYPTVYRKLP